MEPQKSSPKSSPSSQTDSGGKKESITDEGILELPDGSKFQSKKLPIPMDEMIRWCEECLPIWNARPGAEAARLRDKIDVEFIL